MPQWIERQLMPKIHQAINAEDRFSDIFFITSKGGEGKTILLRQVGQYLGSEDGILPCFRWSGILDLYHSEVNNNNGLELYLSRALETEVKEFADFWEQREAFTTRREAGLSGPELEKARVDLAQKFAECLNRVTRWNRVVIALDTTERIQYEVDEIQELCEMDNESTTVKAWLLNQIKNWENCVVILVGRPEAESYLGQDLKKLSKLLPHHRLHVETLGGFNENEAQEYFTLRTQKFPVINELEPEFLHKLWKVTEGRPIRLDLALEVIQYGLGFDQFRQQVENASTEEKIKETIKEIDRLLIERVMKGEPDDAVRDVLRYLAFARKGLSAELLFYLTGEDRVEICEEQLDAIAERSFIKLRVKQSVAEPEKSEKLFFLHDAMYQLCDENLLRADAAQPDNQRIVQWYDEQIKACQDTEKKQDLQIDSVLYRLRAAPYEGYHYYFWLDDEAIRSIEVGFDFRLTNEVIAFLKSPSPIDDQLRKSYPNFPVEFNYDSAGRWVKRLLFRGESNEAIRVAEKILSVRPDLWPDHDDLAKFSRAEFDVYYAQALIYSGQAQKAVDNLKQIITELEGDAEPETLAVQEAKTNIGQRRNLALGRAHNNLGYVYWMHFGYSDAALDEFWRALPYFRASNFLEELANTNDNMGRVYALRGRPARAEALVDDGLQIRQSLGRHYRIGLSLNSRAIVHLWFAEPHLAYPVSQQALTIFDGLGAKRGKGLALITVGHTLRKLGEQWSIGQDSFTEFEKFFGDGARHLEQAVSIFSQEVDEPVRLGEAYNELGCLYRDRAILAQKRAPNSPQVRNTSAEAVRVLKKGIELAIKDNLDTLYVDTCEDLAQTYIIRGEYDTAKSWLDRAEEKVPDDYKYKDGSGLLEAKELKPYPVEEFWVSMGKIELRHGSLIFAQQKTDPSTEMLQEALRHYLLSAAYFERFSDKSIGLRTTFKRMYNNLKGCNIQELTELRKYLYDVADSYHIDLSRLGSFFEDTFGLAIDLPR